MAIDLAPVGRAYRRLTEKPQSLYAAAVLRIGYGLLFFVMLAREFPDRHEIWGPQSPWTPELARRMSAESGWFTFLTLSDSRAYFEVCYAVALLIALLFLLGWRTRVVSILFALVVVAFYGRNVLITDGGDNLTVLMAIYLCFTACGRRWSLDARRPAPASEGLRPFAVTVLHNCAMLVIMAQMCILYGAAGLYQVQGALWENGTALHYVVNSDLFRPWPALSDLVDGHHVLMGIAGYVTVLVQVAFPFSLFSKLKYVLLVILIGMHAGIAVLVGLPMFSAVMVLGDAVFLPDRLFRFLAREARARIARRCAPEARAISESRAVPVR
jgi:hypothetical protein